jgi:hypothetical protein
MRFVGARLLHYPRLCVRTIEMVVGWEACKGVGVGSTEDERRRRGELLRRDDDTSIEEGRPANNDDQEKRNNRGAERGGPTERKPFHARPALCSETRPGPTKRARFAIYFFAFIRED